MDVDVESKEKGKIKVSVDDPSFANLISTYVWNEKGVKFAASAQNHPDLDRPEVIVRANKPKQKLKKAAKSIVKIVAEIKKSLD